MARERLKNYTDIIRHVLTHHLDARDDDFILYMRTASYITTGITNDLRFGYVMRNAKKLGLPTFGTAVRLRALLQKEYPHLQGTKVEKRAKAEDEIRNDIGKGIWQ